MYENSKEGLEHYASIISNKPYSYSKHIAPHDIAVREFGSGITRLEKAAQLGVEFTVAPNLSVVDGIEAVRSAFSKVWIDDRNCAPLIKALENYRQEFDSKKKSTRANLYTIGHLIMLTLCGIFVSLCSKTQDGLRSEDVARNYNEARYGVKSNLPPFFR